MYGCAQMPCLYLLYSGNGTWHLKADFFTPEKFCQTWHGMTRYFTFAAFYHCYCCRNRYTRIQSRFNWLEGVSIMTSSLFLARRRNSWIADMYFGTNIARAKGIEKSICMWPWHKLELATSRSQYDLLYFVVPCLWADAQNEVLLHTATWNQGRKKYNNLPRLMLWVVAPEKTGDNRMSALITYRYIYRYIDNVPWAMTSGWFSTRFCWISQKQVSTGKNIYTLSTCYRAQLSRKCKKIVYIRSLVIPQIRFPVFQCFWLNLMNETQRTAYWWNEEPFF